MQAERGGRPGQGRSRWAGPARAGLAYWFFGNLYEAVVDIPALLADAQQQRAPRLLGPGSPVRYYVPAAPLTLIATGAALIEGWRSHGDRRVITTAAASMVAATAVTAYLVRTVNVRLLRSHEPLSRPNDTGWSRPGIGRTCCAWPHSSSPRRGYDRSLGRAADRPTSPTDTTTPSWRRSSTVTSGSPEPNSSSAT